ncbi:MAG: Rossman fold protein, TIGR00730 family [Nitrospirae bacterium GWC2_56_14]|nr:MAG: Rossman fold protein, TIGR00730 family [Nitrospirae bacterium GWC2_56_14]
MTGTTLRTICVYCGSSIGREASYAEQARLLGTTLARRGYGLVYGGAQIGLMGIIADAVLEAGGKAVGVMPKALLEKEVGHSGLTEFHVVESMHDRKALMAELADGFVALPGGIGTFEELFEIWTWAQLGFHRKPCGLLNVAGYYDHLVAFLDHAAAEGFVKEAQREMLIVAESVDELLARFERYMPPPVAKVIDRQET